MAAPAQSPPDRARISGARRVVVKVGPSSLTTPAGGLDVAAMQRLATALSRRARCQRLVLVSSGAVTAGTSALRLRSRPTDLATAQAAASVGQGLLLARYTEAFAEHGERVGQVLLTAEGLARRHTYTNARRALERLLSLGVVPIVNENETVATEGIRLGDNDRLAALVAHLVHADALVLLTDVDGTHGAGRATELEAVAVATGSGIPVVLTSATTVESALAGGDVGTYFPPSPQRRPARWLWLAHAARPRGRLHLDAGAAHAVTDGKGSLLAAGIIEVEGDFEERDVVELVGPQGLLARGLTAFSSDELARMLGKTSAQLRQDNTVTRAIVHRDHLAQLPPTRAARHVLAGLGAGPGEA
ncbi:glutamate 5-kinase [Georgenia daeguensis]|uniref:Glutamate 5-kinase n=1 Tax=Georgenia daeguensis TaxID=908355 RepID=A0ABP8EYN5_9MICO